jgi:ADP-heptose:LPS heptosyltransferase
MNVGTLQRIDKWFGVPLCALLTVFRRIFQRRLPGAVSIRKLLFVKLAEQGSTVLAYPAIHAAIQMVGKENVYFIVFDDNRFILDAMGVIPEGNVITISFGSIVEMARTGMSALRKVRGLKLDAAIDMEFFARGSAILAFLSGAKWRVGFHPFYDAGPYRGDLMTHRLLYNPHLHTSETFLCMVRALGQDPSQLPTMGVQPAGSESSPPAFVPGAAEVEKIQTLVRAALGNCPRLVLLNPNASDLLPLRRWPPERYVQLARFLLRDFPEVRIAFTGAPNEAGVVGELAGKVGSTRCVSFAGKTTLRELLGLFTIADVLVTNDSGPAHFATLTPIRVVTLFGPETPALYSARSPRNVPLWAGIVCSPCVNAFNNRQSPCRNNVCMQSISVEQVHAEVARALAAGRATTPAVTAELMNTP